jgi:hypothetical protein
MELKIQKTAKKLQKMAYFNGPVLFCRDKTQKILRINVPLFPGNLLIGRLTGLNNIYGLKKCKKFQK